MTPREIAWMLSATLFGALAAHSAHADIYTWTDKSGQINISNMPPPDGIKPTRVTKELPKPPEEVRVAAIEADRRAEVQMLESRVRQLEREVDMARSMPPPMAYMPPPQPMPSVNYVMNVAPPQQQQGPGWNSGYGYGPGYCDNGWSDSSDCTYSYGGGFYPGYYGVPVFVVSPPFFRNNRPPFHNGGGQRPRPMPQMQARAPSRGMR
jgi:hypothetical protein